MVERLFRITEGVYVYPGLPFAYIKSIDALVMADLHLGFEEAAARGLEYSLRGRSGYAGVFLPRIQFRRTVEMLGKAFRIHKPSRVVINGDLKHAFDRLLKQERDETLQLIEFIRSNGVDDITLVRGNHDNFIKGVLERNDVLVVDSIELNKGKILITHGHSDIDPTGYELVVIGHEHPSIRCFSGQKIPSFFLIPLKTGGKILVIPATGPYHPGTSFTLNPEDYLSPLIKNYGELDSTEFISWIETGQEAETFQPYSPVFENPVISLKDFKYGDRYVTMTWFKNPVSLQLFCEF
ncbi:metallophosphoesterase [Thermogladius sp. 4427co]|uniref:metallophosphoesterase n=1 Tax=Thermogladius sp. 4427co TaxID=3450718 RepID=UPI003F7944EC